MIKFICTSFLFWLTSAVQAQTGKVVLNIQGIQLNKGGEISAGIFKKEDFPKVGKQMIGTEKVVTANKMQIVFDNVPGGTYGAVAFQDIDKNKDLKTNFLGFPKEPIGFSNDARINFGPPSFEDAAVKLDAGKTVTLTIILR